jgi:hypothetical protein
MQERVRAGLQAGKTADVLAREIDLSKHGSFGANAEHNGASIRSMTKRLSTAR